MSRVLIGAVLVAFAVTMGCTCGGGGGGASTAEGAAKGFLEAGKAKDVEKMLNYVDLKGMYDTQIPEEAKKDMPFEKFKEQLVAAAKEAADKDTSKKPDYRKLKVTEEGDTATVTVELTEDGKTWNEQTIKLKKVDGKWVVPFDEMAKMGD
jgi:hypothetical protein